MIHVALVGCGGHADFWHAELLKKIPEITVVALCDPTRASKFKAKHFPDAFEFCDYETLLECPSARLDAVVLATPHTLHYRQAKAALERGLHVLVDKPMVTTSEDAYELWRTVNRTGKKLGIAFQAPYTAEFQAIARMRDSGELGKVQIIQGWLAQGWLNLTANSWRQKPALSGGGQMYDSGAHLLNSMMWIMNVPVVEVACFYDKVGAPVDINGVAAIKFQNGALGSFAIGGNCHGLDASITIQSESLIIKTDLHGQRLTISRNGKSLYPTVSTDDRPAGGTPHRNFVDAILGNAELQMPVRSGVLLSALMDALYESADTGRIVKVQPVPESL